MSRSWWGPVRAAIGLGILAVLLWRLGTRPFVEGLRTIDGPVLVAALGITVVTTVCSAWRWSVVAGGLGMRLPLPTAVAAYYRSQFLNTVLPGGVLGDVDRGLRHGRAAGDRGRGLRAVVLERSAGQVLQVAVTLLVLVLLPSPLGRPGTLVALSATAAVAVVMLLAAVVVLRHPRLRGLGSAGSDLRRGLLQRRLWPRVTIASALVVAGHAATFLLAARVVGVTSPTLVLGPLALLVLLAMGLPTNIAGWGPREGAAAWVFGAAGVGADRGVAVAVAYGVMVVVAVLPGAVLLLVDRWPRSRRRVPEAVDVLPAESRAR
ncbi:MAG TPA: lysylphosphatidylglycerol synthase transmembrane domain-containing protein [Segeticoccus sp.]|nr:lysylphosphatidylglycerol synthase transmembrane domain-containing protein [Segeticoccus sp.]